MYAWICCTCVCVYACMRACVYAYICVCMHVCNVYACMCMCACVYMKRICVCMCACVHVCTGLPYAHKHTHIHTHIHTHARTHARTHACTHTHTHTPHLLALVASLHPNARRPRLHMGKKLFRWPLASSLYRIEWAYLYQVFLHLCVACVSKQRQRCSHPSLKRP